MIWLALSALVWAGSWTHTTPAWPIKAPGPKHHDGDAEIWFVAKCPVNPNFSSTSTWGCPASDAGQTFPAKDQNGVTVPQIHCLTYRKQTPASGSNPASDLVYAYARFQSDIDTDGWAMWPSSWPTYVTCSKTMSNGDVHQIKVPITDAPGGEARMVLPVVKTAISLSTGSSLTVPANYDNAGRRYYNLPDGNYTGASATGLVWAKTTATGSVDFAGVKCGVASQTDDYLVVYAHENSANGTAYCPITKDGVSTRIPITISTP
jgi:hypothetical protein